MGYSRFLLTRDIDRLTAIFNEVNITFKKSQNVYNGGNGSVLPEKVEKKLLLKVLKCTKRLLKELKAQRELGIKCQKET